MDPSPIVQSDWQSILDNLFILWLIVGTVIMVGGSWILAHVFIPSLVGSGHLPQKIDRIRPLFYVAAIVAAVGLGALVYSLFGMGDMIERFYWNGWF